MSLLYTLFRIPRNFDEFVDMTKKKDHGSITVTIDAGDVAESLSLNYHCIVGLRTGTKTMELAEFVHYRSGNPERTHLAIQQTERACLQEAVETAERLQSLGLEAKIGPKSIGQAKEDIAAYDAYIEHAGSRLGINIGQAVYIRTSK